MCVFSELLLHVVFANCTLSGWSLLYPLTHTHASTTHTHHTHTTPTHPTHTHSTGTQRCYWKMEQRACSITCSCSTHSYPNPSVSSVSGTPPLPSSTRTVAPSLDKAGHSRMWLTTSAVTVSLRAKSSNTFRRKLR